MVLEPSTAAVSRAARKGPGSDGEAIADTVSCDSGMLEFLYPAKTLALARRLSLHGIEYLNTCHLQSRTTLTPSRQYSSARIRQPDRPELLSAHSIASLKNDTEDAGQSKNLESTPAVPAHLLRSFAEELPKEQYKVRFPAEALRDRLLGQIPHPTDAQCFETVWQLYLQVDENQRRSKRTVYRLVRFLSFSERHEDLVRSTFLLNSDVLHPEGDQGRGSLWNAILMRLCSGSIQRAVSIYENALRIKLEEPPHARIAGLLLAHALREGQWEAATTTFELWNRYQREDTAPLRTAFRIAYQLPNLLDLSFSYLRHLGNNADLSSKQRHPFLVGILGAAAMHSWIPRPDGVHKLFQEAAKLGFKDEALYKMVMAILAGRLLRSPGSTGYVDQRGFLFDLYQQYREIPGNQMDRKLLAGLLQILAQRQGKSKFDIEPHIVLEDYRRLFGELDGYAAAALMDLYARERTMFEVQKLFDDLPKTQDSVPSLIRPLLNIYADRGELSKVEQQFSRISEEFNAKPNIECWNIVLKACTKAGDLDKALSWYDRLSDSGLAPDQRTVGPLLHLCAQRGDTESVIELLDAAKSKGVPLNTVMLGSLVLAHTKNQRLKAAEEAAKMITQACEQGHVKGSLTQAWNFVLSALALQRNLVDTLRVFKFMQERRIESDTHTHASLILALSLVHRAADAYRLLRYVMPSKGIPATNQHYSYLMLGYLRQQQPQVVITLYGRMIRLGIKPDSHTHTLYLEARCHRAVTKDERKRRQYLQQLMERINNDADQTASAGSVSDPLDSYFERMILTFGSNGLPDIVDDLIQEYLKRKKSIISSEALPLRILGALMHSHWRSGEHEDVMACWKQCVEQADVMIRSAAGLPAAERSQTLSNPSYRTREQRSILARPLVYFLRSLKATSQHQLAKDTVESLLAKSYALDNPAWNAYVQALASSSKAQHIIEAFQICEEKLMPKFPGWVDRAWLQTVKRRRARWEGGFDYMKTGPLGQTPAGQRDRFTLIPQFYTMLALRKVYTQLVTSEQSKSGTGAEGIELEWHEPSSSAAAAFEENTDRLVLSIDGLQQVAPNAVNAVIAMPSLRIPMQMRTSDNWVDRTNEIGLPTELVDPNAKQRESDEDSQELESSETSQGQESGWSELPHEVDTPWTTPHQSHGPGS
jgi:pentatricopeptide repeat protein